MRYGDLSRILHNKKASRTTIGKGEPSRREGSDGDITIREVTGKGIFLFVKYNNNWYSRVLFDGAAEIGMQNPGRTMQLFGWNPDSKAYQLLDASQVFELNYGSPGKLTLGSRKASSSTFTGESGQLILGDDTKSNGILQLGKGSGGVSTIAAGYIDSILTPGRLRILSGYHAAVGYETILTVQSATVASFRLKHVSIQSPYGAVMELRECENIGDTELITNSQDRDIASGTINWAIYDPESTSFTYAEDTSTDDRIEITGTSSTSKQGAELGTSFFTTLVAGNNYRVSAKIYSASGTLEDFKIELGGITTGTFDITTSTTAITKDFLVTVAPFTDDTQAGAISSGTTITMDGANSNIAVGMEVSGGTIPANTRITSIADINANPQVFVISQAISSSLSGGTTLTFSYPLRIYSENNSTTQWFIDDISIKKIVPISSGMGGLYVEQQSAEGDGILKFRNYNGDITTLSSRTASTGYLPLAGGNLSGNIIITDATPPQLQLFYDESNSASFSVNSNGATTITTIDSSGASGHLNIEPDGHVEFDNCGVGFDLVTPTYNAADTNVDFTTGNKQFVTFGAGNIADLNLIFPKVSGNFTLLLKQDGTGSRTVAADGWLVHDRLLGATASGSATVIFAGGSNPTLTTDANHVDIISFFYDADNEIAYGVATLDFQF